MICRDDIESQNAMTVDSTGKWKKFLYVLYNLLAPILYCELVNYFVVPAINSYLLEFEFFDIYPPLVGNMQYSSACALVLLQSIKYQT